MFKVHPLSALYVSAPPAQRQKLFDNDITTALINFSEYFFSIPCWYPSFTASLDLKLTEVPSSTLNRVELAVLWFLMGCFWKSLWKVAAAFAVIKIGNRLGFIEPPNIQTFPRRGPSPAPLPPTKGSRDPEILYPFYEINHLRSRESKPQPSPDIEFSELGSFVIIDPPARSRRDLFSPLSSSQLCGSFVMVNPDENDRPSQNIPSMRGDSALSCLNESWVVLSEEGSVRSNGSSDVSSNLSEEPPSELSNLSSSCAVISEVPPERRGRALIDSFVLLGSYIPENSL